MREAAAAIGISYSTFRKNYYAQKLPFRARKIGGIVVFPVAEIQRFLVGDPAPADADAQEPPAPRRGRPRKALQ